MQNNIDRYNWEEFQQVLKVDSTTILTHIVEQVSSKID